MIFFLFFPILKLNRTILFKQREKMKQKIDSMPHLVPLSEYTQKKEHVYTFHSLFKIS